MRSTRGQTALALVFVIGGIIVLFGTTLAFLAFSFLNSTYGFQAANRASALARGGVDDAMLQLLRNKNFESVGYCVPNYDGPVKCPADHVLVIVTRDMPIVGQTTVRSEATVSRYRRKFEAVFSVNASTSLVKLTSSQQISL
jgi:hypothetical protein